MQQERGMTIKQAIDKTSEYCMILRNRYHVTPVIVQQQSVESESNDSIKLGRVRPTIGNLSDSKYTGKDANVILGIFSPFRFELPEYSGYNVSILKDNFRLLEVIINRGGSPGGTIGLFFDGRCNFFKELPLPNTSEMETIYKWLKQSRDGKVMLIKSSKVIKKKLHKSNIFATLKNKFKNH